MACQEPPPVVGEHARFKQSRDRGGFPQFSPGGRVPDPDRRRITTQVVHGRRDPSPVATHRADEARRPVLWRQSLQMNDSRFLMRLPVPVMPLESPQVVLAGLRGPLPQQLERATRIAGFPGRLRQIHRARVERAPLAVGQRSERGVGSGDLVALVSSLASCGDCVLLALERLSRCWASRCSARTARW